MIVNNLLTKTNLITILFTLILMTLFFPILTILQNFLLVIFGVYLLMNKEITLPKNIGLVLFYLLLLTYFWGLFRNGGILYQLNKSEIRSLAYLLVVTLLIGPLTIKEFNEFIKKTANIISILVPGVALFSFYKLSLLNRGIYLPMLYTSDGRYPPGTSLVPDYNMFSLGLALGLVLIMRNYTLEKSIWLEIYYLVSINIIMLSMFLTGSRRAYVILIMALIGLLIILFRKLIKSSTKLRNIALIFLFIMSSLGIINQSLGSDSVYGTNIERVLNRYETVSSVDEGFSSRNIRWDYAIEIFEQGNGFDIIFGQGFGYLKMFQNKFNLNHEDYPHNFLLSTLISSGFIGLLVTLAYLFYVSIKLIFLIGKKNVELVSIIMLLFMLLFLSISGNLIFSIRILPVYLIIIMSVISFDKREIKKIPIMK